MKIAYLAAGAAGMYCGSCLHDNTLVAALIEQGEDVLLIPTYTPLRTDERDVSQRRVFFGGINVYLQEKLALFRHTPWWFDRMLDSPALLNLAGRRAGSTSPEKLGDLTVSMLAGEEGHQKKELEKLTRWLADEVRPDVVHLSNALLLGMATRLHRELGVPVVCSLSGEDIFFERLLPNYASEARALMQARAGDVAAFVALNQYYANAMAEYLDVEPQRIEVIRHGLRLEGHAPRPAAAATGERTVGYLARVCRDKGLHLLVEAFIRLAHRDDLPPLRLKVAGYMHPSERPFLASLERDLAAAGLADRYEYIGEPNRAGKIAFLQSLDVFGLPTLYRESKGLPVLEAWANAVPVVLPAHGTFPELVEETGGGLLFPPGDVDALAERLARLLTDPEFARQHGLRGEEGVRARYTAPRMATETLDLYRRLVGRAD